MHPTLGKRTEHDDEHDDDDEGHGLPGHVLIYQDVGIMQLAVISCTSQQPWMSHYLLNLLIRSLLQAVTVTQSMERWLC